MNGPFSNVSLRSASMARASRIRRRTVLSSHEPRAQTGRWAEETVIEMQNLSFGYSGGDPLLADMTLSLQPGSFHFLTGPSGRATTFLRGCAMPSCCRPRGG